MFICVFIFGIVVGAVIVGVLFWQCGFLLEMKLTGRIEKLERALEKIAVLSTHLSEAQGIAVEALEKDDG